MRRSRLDTSPRLPVSQSLDKMLSSDFYRSSATQGLMRAGRVGGASVQVPSFTSRTVASFAAGRMAAPSFAAASVREAGFTAFAAKEGGKDDWVQAFLKDLAAVRRLLLNARSASCARVAAQRGAQQTR